MPLKNHYQILRLPPTATLDDIKRSFRKLAHQFHPDKNSEASSAQLFREIQEAYFILSDKQRKKLYDEERYFSGLSSRREPSSISADWVLKLATELAKHTAYMHSYDMNHKALHDYVMLILSDLHLAVLQAENNEEKNTEIVESLLSVIKKMDYLYYEKVIARLLMFTVDNSELQQRVEQELALKRSSDSSEKLLPWIVLVIVFLLCVAMYFYSRHRS